MTKFITYKWRITLGQLKKLWAEKIKITFLALKLWAEKIKITFLALKLWAEKYFIFKIKKLYIIIILVLK